jgi:hypothetical protein
MERVGWDRRGWLVGSLVVALTFAPLPGARWPAAAQARAAAGEEDGPTGKDDEKGGGDEPGDEEGAPDQAPPRPSAPSEREIEVLQLFHASKKSFEDGKLVLTYDFSTRDEELLEDWTPKMAALKPKLHWSTSGESYVAEHESTYVRKEADSQGVVMSDNGQWMHKAVFLPDVEVSLEVLNLAIHRPGTLMGPIFYNSRKKESIGVNGGFQFISSSGGKPAKPFLPLKTDKVIERMQQYSFGYRLQDKVLECIRADKKVLDTKVAQGFDNGRVGLFWTGSIQCFVFRATLKGRLDPVWLAEQLVEKKTDSGKGGHAAKK